MFAARCAGVSAAFFFAGACAFRDTTDNKTTMTASSVFISP